MYDRNDRRRGQADGTVNGATKEGSHSHGVDGATAVRWIALAP